jgi:hypothetical protein
MNYYSAFKKLRDVDYYEKLNISKIRDNENAFQKFKKQINKMDKECLMFMYVGIIWDMKYSLEDVALKEMIQYIDSIITVEEFLNYCLYMESDVVKIPKKGIVNDFELKNASLVSDYLENKK